MERASRDCPAGVVGALRRDARRWEPCAQLPEQSVGRRERPLTAISHTGSSPVTNRTMQ